MLTGREVRVGPGGSASCPGDAQVSRAPAVWAASFLGGRVRASPRALGGLSRRRGHSQCEQHKGNPPVPHTRLAAAPARCLATDANRTTSTALGAAIRRRGATPTRPAVVKPTALGDGVGSKSGSVPGRWVTASGGRGNRRRRVAERPPHGPSPRLRFPFPFPSPFPLPSLYPPAAAAARRRNFFLALGRLGSALGRLEQGVGCQGTSMTALGGAAPTALGRSQGRVRGVGCRQVMLGETSGGVACDAGSEASGRDVRRGRSGWGGV